MSQGNRRLDITPDQSFFKVGEFIKMQTERDAFLIQWCRGMNKMG